MALNLRLEVGDITLTSGGIVTRIKEVGLRNATKNPFVVLEVAAPRDIQIQRIHDYFTNEKVQAVFDKFDDLDKFEAALNELFYESD